MPLCDSREIANRILANVHRRERTDLVIEPLLVLVVIIAFMVLINYFMLSLLISTVQAGEGISELFFNIGLYMVLHLLIITAGFYLLMSRNENHSKREDELRSLLMEYFRCKVEDHDIQRPLRGMVEVDEAIRSKERPVSTWRALIWIGLPLFITVLMVEPALSLVAAVLGLFFYFVSFLVLVYVIRNITNFSYNHERRWRAFQKHVVDAAERIGMRIEHPCRRTIGIRSFMVFIVISVLTYGAFFPIWIWLLLKDMNRHFEEQWRFEESLIDALREMEGASGMRASHA